MIAFLWAFIANSCEFLGIRGSYFSWESNDNLIEIFCEKLRF
jgi:hypothetical protein